MSDGRLLERERELETLAGVLARAAAGAGGLAIVEGPAGIGKTRLLAEARRRAAAENMLALRARASELELGYPFGVVRQLLEPALARTRDVEPLFAGAARLARGIVDAGAPASAERLDDGFVVLHGLYWLAANLAERQPLLLTVDDVQWCDASSLQFLAYLAPRLDDLAIALVLGLRTGEPEPGDAAFAALIAERSATRVRPAPLSETAVHELLLEAFAVEPEGRFARACHRSTAGNPLLVHELAGGLLSIGVKPTAASADAVPGVGAEAVRGFVLRRLERLTAAARSLAESVAVLDDRAELEHAAALAGLERAQAADAAGALVRANLLERGMPLGYVHPLVRHAVYATLGPAELERAHARAAELLAAAGSPAERVALHVLRAAPGAVPAAVQILGEAARRSVGEDASAGAVAFLRRALAEPVDAAARPGLLRELGQAELRVDPAAAVETLREAAGLAHDAGEHAEAELLLARALYAAARSSEAIEVLETTLAAGPFTGTLQEHLEYELLNALVADVQMERAVEQAEAIYRQHAAGSRELGQLGFAVLGWLAHVLPLSRRHAARFAAAALADDVLLREDLDAFLTVAFGLVGSDDYAGARVAFEKLRERAVERGSVFSFAGSASLGARLFQFLGELGEAEAEARVGLDAAESHGFEGVRPWLAAALGDVLIERGRLDEASALVRSARSSDPERELFDLLVTDMELHLALGRPEGALPMLAELRRRFAGARGGDVPAPLAWRSTGARALAALGRTDEALELARTDVEFARRWGAPRPLGRALRMLGVLEEGDAALAALGEAVSVLEGSPARLELAHALAALGSATRRSGRRAEARDLLRRALELAHLSGAHALEAHVRDELSVAGARPRRVRLHGPDALTASELRVAQLAASGRSNKEIAQALFVSLKTVEMHLASGYRKLDIRSRTQLPAVLGALPSATT